MMLRSHADLWLNDKLNRSEARLRKRIGDAAVDGLIEQVLVAVKDEPQLYRKLSERRDPYRWIAEQWAPKQRH